MPHNVKIATCCYCGTRAALKLDKSRHELACAACGAPLHNMKALPVTKARTASRPVSSGAPAVRTKPRKKVPYKTDDHDRYRKPKRKKHRKGLGRWVLEEVWDVVEDIFD